jgi:hypothetical protein
MGGRWVFARCGRDQCCVNPPRREGRRGRGGDLPGNLSRQSGEVEARRVPFVVMGGLAVLLEASPARHAVAGDDNIARRPLPAED